MEKPIVYIPSPVYNNIVTLWKRWAHCEWSLIAKVWTYNNKLIVKDFFIPAQENDATNTEMFDIQGSLITYLQSKQDMAKELGELNQWRCWIHSHNTMQPFWSGTDHDTKKELSEDIFYDETQDIWRSLSIVIWSWEKFHATIDTVTEWYRMSNDVDVMKLDIDVKTINDEEIKYKLGQVSPKIRWLANIFKSDVFDSIVQAYDTDAFEMLKAEKEEEEAIKMWKELWVVCKESGDVIEELKSKERKKVHTYTVGKERRNHQEIVELYPLSYDKSRGLYFIGAQWRNLKEVNDYLGSFQTPTLFDSEDVTDEWEDYNEDREDYKIWQKRWDNLAQ